LATIILPIHPKHVKNIINKTKLLELRKSFPKQTIDTILVYETSPTSKVVAVLSVEQLIMEKEEFYKKYKNVIGVTKEDFFYYYKKQDSCYAYNILDVSPLSVHLPLSNYGFTAAPQNFFYIKT